MKSNGAQEQHNPIGSSLDDFLEEEGILAEVEALAIKRVLAHRLREKIEEQKLSRRALARSIGTSTTQVDRILDPENTSITLGTMTKAASVVGLRVKVALEAA